MIAAPVMAFPMYEWASDAPSGGRRPDTEYRITRARGCPCLSFTSSNVTRCRTAGREVRSRTALIWKNTRAPPSAGSMNPKPRASFHSMIVP